MSNETVEPVVQRVQDTGPLASVAALAVLRAHVEAVEQQLRLVIAAGDRLDGTRAGFDAKNAGADSGLVDPARTLLDDEIRRLAPTVQRAQAALDELAKWEVRDAR